MSEDSFKRDRELLAERLANAGHAPAVVSAFARVPRHLFMPAGQRPYAYEDRALPIGEGQTISQPSMIALMLDALALHPRQRVLEVGAGSGYAAALLGCIVAEVSGVELSPILAHRATRLLEQLGVRNVHVVCGDGWGGLPEAAPFDAILVSASPEEVPPALPEQLRLGGRIAIPVGDRRYQVLRVGTLTERGLEWSESVPCLFVPLVHTGATPVRFT